MHERVVLSKKPQPLRGEDPLSLLQQLLGGLVVHGVRHVVEHAVRADQAEVGAELGQSVVPALVYLGADRGEVHRVVDDAGVPGGEGVIDRKLEEVVDILLLQLGKEEVQQFGQVGCFLSW